MQEIEINPSIAAVVHIKSISFSEDVNIYFDAESAWVGVYRLSIWNSFQKNTVFIANAAVIIANQLMTLNINPSVQNLPAGSYYYEISNTDTKRIIFKGQLQICK